MANQYLMDARALKEWSVEDMSQKLHIAEKTYRSWEAGTHIPQMKQLKSLCRVFSEAKEKLGYIIENGHIRLRTAEDDLILMYDPEKPPGSLALAYKEMIESLHQSLTLLLGRGSSEAEVSELDKLMHVVLFILAPSLDMTAVGVGMWFSDRANKLKAIGTCGLRITVQQYLAIVSAEIESWKRMIDEDYQPTEAYLSTRRMVIGSMALFPASFLTAAQFWPMSDVVAQGFVVQCAPCIMACSYLLKGDGLAAVEKMLPQYLPQLVRLAKQPSPAQKEAAYLAAQGLCLMGIVKGHRRQLREKVAHCKQAIELAKVAGDRVLVAATYTQLGTSYSLSDQPQKYLEAYQDAERLFAKEPVLCPARLQSRIYMGLANAHARLGHMQEAERYLAMANAILLLPDDDLFIPALDYDLSGKIGMEGQIYVNLGNLRNPDPDQPPSREARSLYEQADAAYGQPLPALADVRERGRIQNLNEQAVVAIRLGSKEKFVDYFTQGAKGSKALKSDARLLEAKKAWRLARKRWPDEDDVQNLDELLD
jgi:DNA-binding XRE family transcriptional regulator